MSVSREFGWCGGGAGGGECPEMWMRRSNRVDSGG